MTESLLFAMFLLAGFAIFGAFATPEPDDDDESDDGGSDGGDTDDGTDDGDTDDEETPTQLLIDSNTTPVFSDTRGVHEFIVPQGTEDIDVTLSTGMQLEEISAQEWALTGADYLGNDMGPEIMGTGEQENWQLDGDGYALRTGGGGDMVQLGLARNIVVEAGPDDTVIGPSDDDLFGQDTFRDVLIYFTGGATYQGSLASVDLWLSGEDNLVQGGVGNEGIRVLSGAHTIMGGGGTDVIDATAGGGVANQNATATLAGFVNAAGNLMDGGIGNDQLIGSFNDTMTGGEGVDRFTVYFDPDSAFSADGAATITDFVPALESVQLIYGSVQAAGPAPATELRDTMELRETAEGTQIFGDNGELVLNIQGATSLVVVFQSSADGSVFTTADGTPIDPANADVVVSRFFQTTS